jgi:hypothetical protein
VRWVHLLTNVITRGECCVLGRREEMGKIIESGAVPANEGPSG